MVKQEQKKSYALPIAIMFALFFSIAFVTGFSSPMGVIVKDEFGASNFMSQLGIFANFIAYAFMGIPAGLLLKRKGYKFTSMAAVTVGLIGVGIQYLSGAAHSYWVYLIGAFVSGFSMCMLNTVVNPMLNTLGGEGKRGNRLLQFGGSLNSLGATIVPILVGYLMGAASERTIAKATPAMFIAMGIFALAFIVIAFSRIPEPHIEKASEVKKEKAKHSPLSFRHFRFGIIAIFMYVGVEVGVQSILNIFMTSNAAEGGLAMDAAVAGSVVGMYWLLMFIGRLLGGLVGGRVSSRAMLVSMTTLALVLLVLGMVTMNSGVVQMPVFNNEGGLNFGLAAVPMGVMFLALVGFTLSIMWGAIFNLAVEGLGKYVAAGSGIFMVMVCGGGIVPAIQGLVADSAGYIFSYIVPIIGVAYMLFFALFGSKNVNKNIPVK